MTIRILDLDQHEKYAEALYGLLEEGDSEFVPPLSARSSTTQANLSESLKKQDGVCAYHREMMKQRLLVAEEEGRLLGFVSFKENYVCDPVSEAELPNIYISTVLVRSDGRGKGLTRRMYTVLFEAYERSSVFTRTWSSNGAHLKILAEFGFEPFCLLKNHRGNGIDTVYLKKAKTKGSFETKK